jgi:hypothetical protein
VLCLDEASYAMRFVAHLNAADADIDEATEIIVHTMVKPSV